MKTNLILAEPEKIQVILNLFQFYIYDLSNVAEMTINDVTGLFDYPPSNVDKYWKEKDHWPFLIIMDDKLAGFCLLRKYPDETNTYDIDQFFIFNNLRGKNIGQEALSLLLEKFPGQWLVRVLKKNTGALIFWRKAINRSIKKHNTNNSYTMTIENDNGNEMHFLRFESEKC